MRLITLATCSLNQWAMDFEGNKARIVESIKEAARRGAVYRLGPELEITGYGCEDHFLEMDTYTHSWEVMAEIIEEFKDLEMVLDIGMPVMHRSFPYNCRVFVYKGKILFIRPKLFMANSGNYRELRYFAEWRRPTEYEEYYLPRNIVRVTGQTKVPLGDVVLATVDTCLASETCEELFTPNSPHIHLGLDGVEIFANGSGSHHELRKLEIRIDLMRMATKKIGGIYLYANQQGCDGSRLYYDGSAMVVVNGKVLAQGSQFSLLDVEVITATVDLEEVRSYRSSQSSTNMQATSPHARHYHRVDCDIRFASDNVHVHRTLGSTAPIQLHYHTSQEEIAYGPSCWLWDYLRRSKMGGFFLPLSGGIDSSSTAAIVGIMCKLVVRRCAQGNKQVLLDARRLAGEPEDSDYVPMDPAEFANRIFVTCYMGTVNSSKETRARAKDLAGEIGSYHIDCNVDMIVDAMKALFVAVTGKTPQFRVHGGSRNENVALQNIQARLRMVFGYMLAQLVPWVRGRNGSLLVLGSANVDESLRGYLTKYDCSAADLNPIGSISKKDLRSFISWAANTQGYNSLNDILDAPPTAELEPITETYVQQDEVDMGMTYNELSEYGYMRKVQRHGPVSMFNNLLHKWSHLTPAEIARKVKDFFFYYSINRHKLTVLPPTYHAESYSPDDNRFDLRQFLYPNWAWQFRKIDNIVTTLSTAPDELQKANL